MIGEKTQRLAIDSLTMLPNIFYQPSRPYAGEYRDVEIRSLI